MPRSLVFTSFMASLLALSVAGCAHAPSPPTPSETSSRYDIDRPYLYLSLEPVPPPVGGPAEFRGALLVSDLLPGSPPELAGLRRGDWIIAYGGHAVGSVPDEVGAFRNWFEGLKGGAPIAILREAITPPQTDVRPLLEAAPPGLPIDGHWTRALDRIELTLPVETRQLSFGPAAPKITPHPELSHALAARIEALAAARGKSAALADLRARFAELSRRADPFRRGEVAYLETEPLQTTALARELTDRLATPAGDGAYASARRALAEAARLADVPLPAGEPPRLRTGLSAKAHLDQLEQVLRDCDRDWREAFAALNSEELAFLREHATELTHALEARLALREDPDRDRYARNLRTLALAAKVDQAALYRSARGLMRIGDPAFAYALKRDLARSGLDLAREIVLERKTPFGRIVIGGTGDNQYSHLEDVAVLIDLGGDDTYSGAVAHSGADVHSSIIVDLEGDDSYLSNGEFTQASGVLGTGMIFDLAGNDRYVATRGAQGFGLLGIGLLVDSAGDDHYESLSFSQGVGLLGFGGLVDGAGNDRYQSQIYSQAVGAAGGIGLLLDLAGDDEYVCQGFAPSSYGEPGLSEGWSQGVGFGLRGLASGGIGVLVGSGGHNRFEAGNFSQGGGYYFGLGVLRANGEFLGSRYAQGFAAHYAFGALLADEGRFRNPSGVGGGIGWDVAVGSFEGGRGSFDLGSLGSFNAGEAANNGIGIFIDGGALTGSGQVGRPRENDYHGGSSLSFVQNAAGGEHVELSP